MLYLFVGNLTFTVEPYTTKGFLNILSQCKIKSNKIARAGIIPFTSSVYYYVYEYPEVKTIDLSEDPSNGFTLFALCNEYEIEELKIPKMKKIIEDINEAYRNTDILRKGINKIIDIAKDINFPIYMTTDEILEIVLNPLRGALLLYEKYNPIKVYLSNPFAFRRISKYGGPSVVYEFPSEEISYTIWSSSPEWTEGIALVYEAKIEKYPTTWMEILLDIYDVNKVRAQISKKTHIEVEFEYKKDFHIDELDKIVKENYEVGKILEALLRPSIDTLEEASNTKLGKELRLKEIVEYGYRAMAYAYKGVTLFVASLELGLLKRKKK